jgi:hypothetical protein
MSVLLAKSPSGCADYPSITKLTSVYFENHAVSCISINPVEKIHCFGTFENGSFVDSMESKIIVKAWRELPVYFPNCTLGEYTVSSKNLTGIINVDNRSSQENSRKLIPRIVAYFKARTTKLLNQYHGKPGRIFWENNFEERIIENLNDLSIALDKINSHK